jgi:hypothetical protein
MERFEVVQLEEAVGEQLPVAGDLEIDRVGHDGVAELEHGEEVVGLIAQPGAHVGGGRLRRVDRDPDDAVALFAAKLGETGRRARIRGEQLGTGHRAQPAVEVVRPAVEPARQDARRPARTRLDGRTAVDAGIAEGARRPV